MTLDPEHLDQARKVADAILYEGYLLYPYHQSSQKNQSRFQFGVLMPAAYAELDPSEPSASQTQCLVECGDDAQVRVTVRFLQLQRRRCRGGGPRTATSARSASLTVDGRSSPPGTRRSSARSSSRVSVGELLGERTRVQRAVQLRPADDERGARRRGRPGSRAG